MELPPLHELPLPGTRGVAELLGQSWQWLCDVAIALVWRICATFLSRCFISVDRQTLQSKERSLRNSQLFRTI